MLPLLVVTKVEYRVVVEILAGGGSFQQVAVDIGERVKILKVGLAEWVGKAVTLAERVIEVG